MLNKLYKKLDLFYPTRYLMDILSWLYRLKTIKPINKNNLINIEGIKEYNINYSWFIEDKPLWISWIARLKNWDDFLEKVIESHIPFLDEIILIDNQSTDKTKDICLKLQKKYSNKIKFYEYNFEVIPPSEKSSLDWNSIHSFTYFTNWSISKWKYKYIMKIDDDNLFNVKKWMEIRKYILEKKPNKYITYWWLNVVKKNNILGICNDYPYSWKYWDHWIYPVSNKTYYTQEWEVEKFINPLPYKRYWFSFFHLKFLKKNYWITNYKHTKIWRKQFKMVENCKIKKISFFTKDTKFINYLKKIINDKQ